MVVRLRCNESYDTCDNKLFNRMKEEEREIRLADKEGKKLNSEGIGKILVKQPTCRNIGRI